MVTCAAPLNDHPHDHSTRTGCDLPNYGRSWALSDGNAGAFHTSFYSSLDAIKSLDWDAIETTSWQARRHQKAAEFLVAEFFPWAGFHQIGCHNAVVTSKIMDMLKGYAHQPLVDVKPRWYY